jgi:capsular polysaccharide export protein
LRIEISNIFKNKSLGIYSKGLDDKLAILNRFLPESKHISYLNLHPDIVLGWGDKKRNHLVEKFCDFRKVPYIALEDGFIKSVGLNEKKWPSFSMIIDHSGIYYNTTRISELENIINKTDFNKELLDRAKAAIEKVKDNKITKYNCEVDLKDSKFKMPYGKNILLIDQTVNDYSIKVSSKGQIDFDKMFKEAKKRFPEHNILIKTHPEVIRGKKKGYLKKYFKKIGVYPISENINNYSVFEHVDAVFTVSSLSGMEALIAGKKVYCFGRPFYSGHGLTTDFRKFRRKRKKLKIEELFAASYILYPRYYNPITNKICKFEEALEEIIYLKKKYYQRRKTYHCWGFSIWKQDSIKKILQTPHNEVYFYRNLKEAIKYARYNNESLAIWATKEKGKNREIIAKSNIKPIRVEDGFIRSLGLGSDFTPASSLVLDDIGIYYDPRKESKLENLINNIKLNKKQKERAKELAKSIIENRITKYNKFQNEVKISIPKDRKVILVIGQVEDDASIRTQKEGIKSNLRLLQKVKKDNPKAFIIYKAHPDVVSGNRAGHIAKRDAIKYANLIVENGTISELIKKCNEIHTISSLVGFEALLQNKIVHCYGMPFYAGWGLTKDLVECGRRRKTVTIEELIYATIFEYPIYHNFRTGLPCEPEKLIENIVKYKSSVEKFESGSHKLRILQLLRSYLGRISP